MTGDLYLDEFTTPLHVLLAYDRDATHSKWDKFWSENNSEVPDTSDCESLAILISRKNRDELTPKDLVGPEKILNKLWRLARTESDMINNIRVVNIDDIDLKIELETKNFEAQIVRNNKNYSAHELGQIIAFLNLTYSYARNPQGPEIEILNNSISILLQHFMKYCPYMANELTAIRSANPHRFCG